MSKRLEVLESFGTLARLARFGQRIVHFLRQMNKRPVAFVSMLIVFLFLFLAVFGSQLAPYDFDEIQRGADRSALKNEAPSLTFLMGTDSRGRDVFSRILWGANQTIGLPAAATIGAVFFGTIIGLSSGYFGGWFDEVLSRIMDSLLAIPALVLALVMITTIVPILNSTDLPLLKQAKDTFGANNISLMLVIILLYIPIVTRVVRSATLNVRDRGYIEAAKLRGESTWYILFQEILPSVLPALVVEASLRLSYAIFLIASLGYLGLGIQPPSPEWGRMVFDARQFAESAPWTMFFPIAAIALLIISINLMSDALRRVLQNEE